MAGKVKRGKLLKGKRDKTWKNWKGKGYKRCSRVKIGKIGNKWQGGKRRKSG